MCVFTWACAQKGTVLLEVETSEFCYLRERVEDGGNNSVFGREKRDWCVYDVIRGCMFQRYVRICLGHEKHDW